MKTLDLGEAVGPGVPTGGTANQLLVKNGSTNFDTSWKDAGTIPSIANVQDGLGIVANVNTHAAIAKDQAVYVRNHSTLAEGLYWARSAIGTNAALSTSNLTADASGGLNKLKGDIDSLNSKFAKVLWEGNAFTSGSLTVPGLEDYRVLEFFFSDTLSMIVINAGSNNILWGGILYGAYGSNEINSNACRYGKSSSTLTIDSNNRGLTNGTNSNYSGYTVGLIRVVGLIAV